MPFIVKVMQQSAHLPPLDFTWRNPLRAVSHACGHTLHVVPQ
jgi:hypothetical protein